MAAIDVMTYAFDPQKAAALLDQARCRTNPDGVRICADGVTMDINLLCSSQEVRMAELIRQRLGEVGIRVNVKSVDPKTRDSRVRAGEYELAILGHGGWGSDPDYLVQHFLGRVVSGNAAPSHSGVSGVDSPELMNLLLEQQAAIDSGQRRKLVNRIQKLLAQLVPEIPLFYTTGYTVFRPEKYDGWMFMFDHHSLSHSKLSYLMRTGPSEMRP
jgi:peptide/nickel transport system substrate-binding protein